MTLFICVDKVEGSGLKPARRNTRKTPLMNPIASNFDISFEVKGNRLVGVFISRPFSFNGEMYEYFFLCCAK